MGTPTGKIITSIRATGRGSDYWGTCDQCGKQMAECFIFQTRREYMRATGELYTSPVTSGAHGHKECLIAIFGQPDIHP